MLKKLLISVAVLAGLAALADRGLAVVAGNATAERIRIHEGLREDPDVTFQGFPFITQAIAGEFERVEVTARDVERDDVTIDRIHATLHGVEVDLSAALNGRLQAVPVREGEATLRLTYGDLQTYLSRRPGNIRIALRGDRPVIVSSFGVPGVGSVDVEGTPTVRTTTTSIRVTVSGVRAVAGGVTLTSALAASAAARASFAIPLDDLPFGIQVKEARLTDSALEVTATAEGLVIEVGDNRG